MIETATAASEQAAQSSGSTLSLFVGVIVSFISAILVYSARQYWERKKLHKSLITEVGQMEGIKICADQMGRIDEPPTRQLSSDDVPAENSIPTTIYNSGAGKIGLLGGILNKQELEAVVKFYSKVLRYKSVIRRIGNQQNDPSNNSSPVSDTDQEDLYEKIGKLNTVRNRIIESGSFNVEYPDDLE